MFVCSPALASSPGDALCPYVLGELNHGNIGRSGWIFDPVNSRHVGIRISSGEILPLPSGLCHGLLYDAIPSYSTTFLSVQQRGSDGVEYTACRTHVCAYSSRTRCSFNSNGKQRRIRGRVLG
jgi:hypothetical protein